MIGKENPRFEGSGCGPVCLAGQPKPHRIPEMSSSRKCEQLSTCFSRADLMLGLGLHTHLDILVAIMVSDVAGIQIPPLVLTFGEVSTTSSR